MYKAQGQQRYLAQTPKYNITNTYWYGGGIWAELGKNSIISCHYVLPSRPALIFQDHRITFYVCIMAVLTLCSNLLGEKYPGHCILPVMIKGSACTLLGPTKKNQICRIIYFRFPKATQKPENYLPPSQILLHPQNLDP